MDIEEDRNLQNSYLYENERKLLAGQQYRKELDNEAENKARRRIVNKRIPNLSHRIQSLVDDIALLERGGYLDAEHCSEEWEQLLDIEPRIHLKRDSKFVDPYTWMPDTRLDDEIRLGYTIGQVVRSLTSMADTNVSYVELGWGFTLGLFGEKRPNFDREYNQISDFLQYTEDKIEDKKEYATEIEDIIEMESIEEDFSQYSFGNEYFLGNDSGMRERIERTRAAIVKYKNSHSDPFEGETTDPDLEYLKILENILTNRDEIISGMELMDQIQKSIKLINNSQSGQLFAKDVLRIVWNKDISSVNRSKILQECNASKNQIGEIMNNLGSNPSSKKWMNEPPLVHRESGNTGGKWSLTNLGYVVGYAMFEDNGAEFVYRALGQVITDQHDQHEIHNRISDAIFEI